MLNESLFSTCFLGPVLGRTDFSWIFIFEPPDCFAEVVAGTFVLILWKKVPRKILQENARQNLPNLYNNNPRHISAEGSAQCFTRSSPSLTLFFKQGCKTVKKEEAERAKSKPKTPFEWSGREEGWEYREPFYLQSRELKHKHFRRYSGLFAQCVYAQGVLTMFRKLQAFPQKRGKGLHPSQDHFWDGWRALPGFRRIAFQGKCDVEGPLWTFFKRSSYRMGAKDSTADPLKHPLRRPLSKGYQAVFSERCFSEWCVQRAVRIRKGTKNAQKHWCLQAVFVPLKGFTSITSQC